jgi:hypothetical protein
MTFAFKHLDGAGDLVVLSPSLTCIYVKSSIDGVAVESGAETHDWGVAAKKSSTTAKSRRKRKE